VSSLEIGPIWRSLGRQKTTFALLVVELSAGFVVLSFLTLFGAFVLRMGQLTSGHDEAGLVMVNVATSTPGGTVQGADELARLSALPDVVAAAPLSFSLIDDRWYLRFPLQFWRAEHAPPPRGQLPPEERGTGPGWLVDTSPAFARVLNLSFVEGDGAGAAAGTTVITRCLRTALFGNEPALGRTIAGEDLAPARVVGVVEDVNMQSPFLPTPTCVAFRFDRPPDERERRYVLRTQPARREAVILAAQLAMGASHLDREVHVTRFDSSDGKHHAVGRGVAAVLGMMGLSVGAGALIGAIALSAFLVRQRRRQIGIRRALGASRADIIRYFLVENSIATALGTGLGLLVLLGLLSLAGLSGQQTFVTWTWRSPAASALLLWVGATLAAMLPARRAADIPPSVASRGL
jgi:putative ABC transport system permease protein